MECRLCRSDAGKGDYGFVTHDPCEYFHVINYELGLHQSCIWLCSPVRRPVEKAGSAEFGTVGLPLALPAVGSSNSVLYPRLGILPPLPSGARGPGVMSAVGQPSLSSRPLHSPSQVIEETALGPVTSPSRDIPPSFASSSSSLAGLGAIERLALTRRAPHMMRLHLVRSAIRVTVLMTGDAGALLLLRVLLKGVRDEGWWGSAAAGIMAELVGAPHVFWRE